MFNLQYAAQGPKLRVLSQVVYHCRMGGSASSRRYYPDRHRIAWELVEAYWAYGAELSPVARREWEETVLHYHLHCPRPEARNKVEEAKALLGEFLPGDLSGKTVLRKHWLRLLLRRCKKWAGRVFLCASAS